MVKTTIMTENGRFIYGWDYEYEVVVAAYVTYPYNDESPAGEAWQTTTQPRTTTPHRFYLAEHRQPRKTVETYIARRHR